MQTQERRRRPSARALETAVIAREPLVALLPGDHRNALHERVDLGVLTDMTLITPARSRAPGLYEHAVGAWLAAHGTRDSIHECDSVTTMLALVDAGAGVAITPSKLAAIAWPPLSALPLREHRAAAETGIIWRHSTTSPVLQRFLRLALSTPEPDVLGPEKARSRADDVEDYF